MRYRLTMMTAGISHRETVYRGLKWKRSSQSEDEKCFREETPVSAVAGKPDPEYHFRYGYIRRSGLPILEPVALFERAVGESTDIVSKEMHNFLDKSGEHITLRPEGTSGCVRTVIENNMCWQHHAAPVVSGPMFRYERPAERPSAPVHPVRGGNLRHAGADVGCRFYLYGERYL